MIERRRTGVCWAVAVLLASSACGVRAEREIVRVEDSAGVRLTTIEVDPANVPEWTLAVASNRTLTGAETGDSTAFADVGAAAWLSDGRIVVADYAGKRLLVFDSTGRFLKAHGRRGSGPGELQSITSIAVLPDDNLSTFDAGLRRLSRWHPDTGYVGGVLVGGASRESWPAGAWRWRDSLIAVHQQWITPKGAVPPGGGVRRWPILGRMVIQDSSGRVVAASRDFEAMYTGLLPDGDTRLPFSNQSFVAVGADRAYFGSGQSFQLSYIGAASNDTGEFRWPAHDERLDPAEVAQVRAEAEAAVASRMSPADARKLFETNFAPEILPERRPSIGRVIASANGQVWVERFEPPRIGSRIQRDGDRWTVLEPDGNPVARLLLPAHTRLEAVRGDRALVVVRDSLDVETVQVRAISKASR